MATAHPPFPGMVHQIPFRQPAITAPLTWAFAAAPQALPAVLSPSISKKELLQSSHWTPKSRKRCASEEMEHDEAPCSVRQPFFSLPKRIKTGIGYYPPDSDMALTTSKKEVDVDLGKCFASLSKIELITLLQNLVNQKPDLKSSIHGLLPPPTLESIFTSLSEVEATLLELIPDKRTNREEYIWNRVRVPLNGYVSDCLEWLKLFDKSQEHQQSRAFDRSQFHATISDQFNLLARVTQSIIKVEDRLPSLVRPTDDLNYAAYHPLHSRLIPTLFESWKKIVDTIHQMVFIEGLILSESLILKWFNQLDDLAALTNESKGDSHRLMEVIRCEAGARFGDLVGLKPQRLQPLVFF